MCNGLEAGPAPIASDSAALHADGRASSTVFLEGPRMDKIATSKGTWARASREMSFEVRALNVAHGTPLAIGTKNQVREVVAYCAKDPVFGSRVFNQLRVAQERWDGHDGWEMGSEITHTTTHGEGRRGAIGDVILSPWVG